MIKLSIIETFKNLQKICSVSGNICSGNTFNLMRNFINLIVENFVRNRSRDQMAMFYLWSSVKSVYPVYKEEKWTMFTIEKNTGLLSLITLL